MLLDPLECFSLIEETVVEACGRVVLDLRAGYEAIGSDAVVEIHDDDVETRGGDEATAVVVRI